MENMVKCDIDSYASGYGQKFIFKVKLYFVLFFLSLLVTIAYIACQSTFFEHMIFWILCILDCSLCFLMLFSYFEYCVNMKFCKAFCVEIDSYNDRTILRTHCLDYIDAMYYLSLYQYNMDCFIKSIRRFSVEKYVIRVLGDIHVESSKCGVVFDSYNVDEIEIPICFGEQDMKWIIRQLNHLCIYEEVRQLDEVKIT